jgi:hypothetical protein
VYLAQSSFPLSCHTIKLLGSSASLGSRFAAPGFHESLPFQPIEASIDSTDRYILFRLIDQFLTDRYPIRAIIEPQDYQQQQVLKATEEPIAIHYNCIVVVIHLAVKHFPHPGAAARRVTEKLDLSKNY